jgi:hypothetical protein
VKKRNQIRLLMLIPTALLGSFLVSFFHGCWIAFWLVQGTTQTEATITAKLSHGVVAYNYNVAGFQYGGQSQADAHSAIEVGKQTLCYFSRSRPWLSSLVVPSFPPSGTLFIIIPLLIELLLVMTVINPKGKWALQTGLKQND